MYGPEVRIAILDDHPIFRAGLRKLLESEPGLRVVAEGSDGAQALELVSRTSPDLLLVDFSMPGTDGLGALRLLNEAGHSTRPVMLTAHISRDETLEALRLGAQGVLLKTAAAELLFRCIDAVMRGQYWVDRETAGDLVSALKLKEEIDRTSEDGLPKLTMTERRVLEALQRGSSNKVIARELGIAEQTVKNHLSHLYERFDVANRLELVLKARQLGLLESLSGR